MESKAFRFKQFSVADGRAAHKVGTDAVLLGAWVHLSQADKSILDIGTGSGVIALMLAQRTAHDARIDAVEIGGPDAEQARENVLASPWKEKISVHHLPLQEYRPQEKYDLIVTNPPYFVKSHEPPDAQRSQARHTHHLPFEDLLGNTVRLLSKQGRFALILPHVEGLHFLTLARRYKLFPVRKTTFRSRISKAVERLLIELAFEGPLQADAEIILYAEGENWSEEYRELTRDFYLQR